MFDWFRRSPKVEKRSVGSGFTAEVMRARESYISGRTGLGELTGTVSSCVSLWQNAFASADVIGTNFLSRNVLALIGRSLALRGEFVALIRDDRLVPASDWETRTRDAEPVAYRLSVPEAGGGRTETALAGEVLHVKINADPAAPWLGVSPLRTAALSAALMHTIESALCEVFENMPLGSAIVPYPEAPDQDVTALGRSFRGQRGRILLRESVAVSAAGGPMPATDWRPAGMTPNIRDAMTAETLAAARDAICNAYGVIPALFSNEAQGPAIRECQRHLAMWTIMPAAMQLAEEASAKLGGTVRIDCTGPLDAYDVGGKARALSAIVETMARAKEAGLVPGDIGAALKLVDWTSD